MTETKISDLLTYCDAVKPNAFDTAVKIIWINEIEGMIQTDVMLIASADVVQYDAEDTAAVLLVPAPHDKLYRSYLCAMIDFANGEYDRYNNSMAMFNTHYREFTEWYIRIYRPADEAAEFKGYYISAYGLAVKHGFQGNEEAWLASLKGNDGDQGERGLQGEQGIPGEPGPKGDPGKDFAILGYYASLSALQAAVTTPEAGDAYGVGSVAPYDIYVWDGINLVWVNNGAIQGPKGDQGDTGDPGPNTVSTTTGTNITGLLKGTGSKVAQAVAGTDYAAANHTHSAYLDKSGGTLTGAVSAHNGTDYDTARVRNISAGTADLTAGSSPLASGDIYFVYE